MSQLCLCIIYLEGGGFPTGKNWLLEKILGLLIYKIQLILTVVNAEAQILVAQSLVAVQPRLSWALEFENDLSSDSTNFPYTCEYMFSENSRHVSSFGS